MDNKENETKNKLREFVKKVEDRTNNALDNSLMDDDAKSENYDINYTDIVQNNTKARMSKVPWLVAIFLILIIAISFCFMFFQNNPQTLFTQTIDGLFDYLKSNVNENVYDITDGNITLDFSLKSNDENAELYSELSKISLSADYVKDNSNNMSYIEINSTYDGEEFISGNVYGDGSATYLYVPNISENYIKLSDNKLSYFVNSSAIRVVLEALNQAVDKAIADEKIEGSTEDIEVDGEEVKSYKVKMTIDSKNRDRIAETFINTLKANDEFIKVLANIQGINKSDVTSQLDNYLEALKAELEEHDNVEISLYVNNQTKEFIKADIVSELVDINLTYQGDSQYSYSVYDVSEGTLTTGEFTFTVNDSKTKYTYNFYYKKTDDDEVLIESNFDLKYTTKQASSFERIDVSDSLDLSQMNDLEKLGLYTKVASDETLSKFLPIIRKVV